MKKRKISFEDKLPITSHLEELRWRLVIVLIVLSVAFGVFYTFSEQILLLIKRPIEGYELIILSPTEAFFAHMKLSFFAALFLIFPMIIYEVWAFVSPGLLEREREYTLPLVIFTSVFFILGLGFSYFVIIPYGLKFLLTYKIAGITPKFALTEYIGFFTATMLVFGIIFELPVIILFLTNIGLVKPLFLSKNRKYAILIIFIVSAILTPPDVFSQFLMAIPLLFLYEISILGSRFIYRRRQRQIKIN